jgi:diguanylate cyclase (GGDEF)-like protein
MVSSFERIDSQLRRLPDVVIFVLGLALVAAITTFKETAGHDIPVTDFMLVPVAAVGWLVTERAYAYLAAGLTAIVTVAIAVTGQAQGQLGAALAAAGMRFVLYLVVLALLGAIRNVQLARKTEARTDYLTGAANARAFEEVATAELERSRRYGRPLSLLYLDVDDFKTVNDTFGHAAGDNVLAEVSHMLRCSVRGNDLVARLGGDEFAVLMPETGRFAAVAVARRAREELARLTLPDGETVRSSVGVVSYARPPASVDAMIHDADTLMYRAKEQGKDRIESAEYGGDPAMSAS